MPLLPFSLYTLSPLALSFALAFSGGVRAQPTAEAAEAVAEVEEAVGPWPQPEATETVQAPPPPLDTRVARAVRIRHGKPARHAVAWRIAPTPRSGCDLTPSLDPTRARIAELGAGHASGMSCQMNTDDVGLTMPAANVHADVGVNKALGGPVVTAWGLALEVPAGPVVPHVQVYGVDGAEPTVQVGLAGRPLSDLLFDGKVVRVDGANRYSVGLRLRF